MDKVWDLFVELRKELLEAQKIRAQVLGFKITFVSTFVGVLGSIENVEKLLFIVPAVASVCFDYIIYSYSFSIKRIGAYVRENIEPQLRKAEYFPKDFLLWQEYLTNKKTKQDLVMYGNLGFTILASTPAFYVLYFDCSNLYRVYLVLLVILLAFDVYGYYVPRKLGKIWDSNDDA